MAVCVSQASDGRGRVDVELEGVDGRTALGTAEIEPSATGALKAAASATLHALRVATAAAHDVTLGGVKSVRAFDETVVLVQLVCTPGPVRLVGAGVVDPGGTTLGDIALGDADQARARAAVLAVLSATNRVLSGPDRT